MLLKTLNWFWRGLVKHRYSVPDLVVFALLMHAAPFWLGMAFWIAWGLADLTVREIAAQWPKGKRHV